MASEQLRLLISGRVQGVWYRASTVEMATQLGLVGWVRNLPDGRVEALAEGAPAQLRELAVWAAKGPPLARVTQVEEQWGEASGELEGFRVR